MKPQILIELALLLILGTVMGLVMAVMANGFVEGVSSAANFRESTELLRFTLGGDTYSASSLVILLLAAAVVIAIRRVLKLDSWAGPADSILAAHTDSSDVDIKKGLALRSAVSSKKLASTEYLGMYFWGAEWQPPSLLALMPLWRA
jgi:hypothetical protein